MLLADESMVSQVGEVKRVNGSQKPLVQASGPVRLFKRECHFCLFKKAFSPFTDFQIPASLSLSGE